MNACCAAMAVVLTLASSAWAQDAPPDKLATKPDCVALLSSNPGSGVAQLCQAEDELARGGAQGEGRVHMAAAAALFDRASGSLRDTELKVYAFETLAELYDAEHLNDPRQVELALRALIPLVPRRSLPLRRLARLQEDQGQVDTAENSLLAARQQIPDDVEVYRALSEFYARRASDIASAATGAAHPGREGEPNAAAPGQADQEGYYEVGGGVSPPELVERIVPPWPRDADPATVSGVVTAELKIDESGRVAAVKIIKANPALEEAAAAAFRQWRYAPTMLEGRAVPVKMTVSVDFAQKQGAD